MILPRWALIPLLPLLLACPGPIEGDPVGPPPDPNQPSIGFQYVGPKEVVAGAWRANWDIDRAPAVVASTKTRFSGPGSLANPNMTPTDLNQSYPGAGGYYLPPADVPPEGVTVKLGCSVLSPFTNRWESSPDYEIRVVKKTTPMQLCFGVNTPCDKTEATVGAGQIFVFGFDISPFPASRPDPKPWLVPPPEITADAGSLDTQPWGGDGGWRCVYTAPAVVSAPMDVKVRVQAFDPWVQQNREAMFTIHLQP